MSSHRRSYDDPREIYLFSFHRAGNRGELLEKAQEGSCFTDALVMPQVTADLDLAYLSFDGVYFTFAGLFTSGNTAATGKRRGRFEHLCKLPAPISLASARIDASEIDATTRISPTTVTGEYADHTQSWIERVYPDNIDVLADLDYTRFCLLKARSEPPEPTLLEQRDGVGLLLDIAELDRRELLRRATHGPHPGSLIDILPESTVEFDEKLILEQDMEVFGNWRREDPELKGTRVYSNGKTKVSLLCVDRSHVENVTGVDLIYHLDTYGSFVMVQYKRMSGGIYRPDRRCHRQVARMLETYNCMRRAPLPAPLQERDFRLSDNPFFIKVCEGEASIEASESLIDGMYFQVEHWQHVLNDPHSRGPHGGIILSRRTAPRWFSNTEFIDIAKSGWIGSTRAAGRHWVRGLVQQSLREARSLILARLMKIDSIPRLHHDLRQNQRSLFESQ